MIKNDKTKHAYLVGWSGDWQCVYGKNNGDDVRWSQPFTLTQACRAIKKYQGKYPRVIYKLVPLCRIAP